MTGRLLGVRGPNVKAPARLPALQAVRVDDPQVQKAIEAIREWIEVRLGSRGDPFERAVTARELEQALAPLQKAIATLGTQTVEKVSALPPLRPGGFVQVGDDLYFCNGKAWKKATLT